MLVGSRWPMERLWKWWKEHGKLDPWRSSKPERILSELSAPLLGLLITDWQTVLGGWQAAKRRLVKAKQVGEGMVALAGLAAVEVVVEHTVLMMQTGWTIDWRKKRPHIYHLLADPKLIHSFG